MLPDCASMSVVFSSIIFLLHMPMISSISGWCRVLINIDEVDIFAQSQTDINLQRMLENNYLILFSSSDTPSALLLSKTCILGTCWWVIPLPCSISHLGPVWHHKPAGYYLAHTLDVHNSFATTWWLLTRISVIKSVITLYLYTV